MDSCNPWLFQNKEELSCFPGSNMRNIIRNAFITSDENNLTNSRHDLEAIERPTAVASQMRVVNLSSTSSSVHSIESSSHEGKIIAPNVGKVIFFVSISFHYFVFVYFVFTSCRQLLK